MPLLPQLSLKPTGLRMFGCVQCSCCAPPPPQQHQQVSAKKSFRTQQSTTTASFGRLICQSFHVFNNLWTNGVSSYFRIQTTGNDVKRSTPNANPLLHPDRIHRCHYEPETSTRLRLVNTRIAPTTTPTGCQRGISDSTRPQMRVAIFWALSTFIDVRFSPRVILNIYYLGSKQFFIAKRASRTHALTTLLLSLKQYVRFCFSSEGV